MPDSENNERAVFHAQGQLRSVRAEINTANCFLHVTAGDQGTVSQAPQPEHKSKVKYKTKPTSQSSASPRLEGLLTTLIIRKDTVASH